MQAILKVISEPAAGTMTVIRQGQLLQVGRTSWADFTIPDDAMGDVHFSLEITPDECILRNISEGLPTLLNGEPADEASVADGDEITAGRTVFAVTLQGAPERKVQDNGNEAAAPAITSGYKFVEAALARDVAGRCELDDDVLPQIAADTTTRQFVEALLQQSRFSDGITFLAAAMPKREAVWWGCQSCGGSDPSSLPRDDRKAIEAARAWVVDPSEENRRAAEAAANAGELLTAPSCVAMAAFLSGGSIAPPDLPEVPPPDHLTGHTIACALSLAAAIGSDEAAKRALELGIAIADGKSRWE
jgi:predicted component of type VI protein secretion system